MINSRNFFDKSVKNDIETYGSIRKNAADEGDYFTTVCLLDYSYLNENCKLILVGLSKHADADSKAIQKIAFTGNLERAGNITIFFIIERSQKNYYEFLTRNCRNILSMFHKFI